MSQKFVRPQDKISVVVDYYADRYIDSLECDGLCRIIHYQLQLRNIKTDAYICTGHNCVTLDHIPLPLPMHIFLKDKWGNIIDPTLSHWYQRCKLFNPEMTIPENLPPYIFKPYFYSGLVYKNPKPLNIKINKTIFKILTA